MWYLGYPNLHPASWWAVDPLVPRISLWLLFLQSGTVSPQRTYLTTGNQCLSAEGCERLPKYKLWPGWVIKPVGLCSLTNPQVIPVLLLQAYQYLTPYTPICIAKAVKNASETEGMRRAHVSKVLRSFLCMARGLLYEWGKKLHFPFSFSVLDWKANKNLDDRIKMFFLVRHLLLL